MKNIKVLIITLIFFFSIAGKLTCAEVEITRTEVTETSNNAKRVKYKIRFGTEAILLSTGIVLALPSLFHKKSTPTAAEISLLDRNNINAFDRGATYNYSKSAKTISDISVGVAIALPALLFIDSSPRENFWNIVLMYSESFILTFGLTQFVKTVVDRKRPLLYNPSVPLEAKLKSDNLKSFYSSHTAMAFNAAVFFSTVYTQHHPTSKLNFVVWPLSLGLASFVGVMRYKAGKHYPSDILVGAAIGSLFGALIPILHKEHEKSKVIVMPVTGEFNGLTLMIKL